MEIKTNHTKKESLSFVRREIILEYLLRKTDKFITFHLLIPDMT